MVVNLLEERRPNLLVLNIDGGQIIVGNELWTDDVLVLSLLDWFYENNNASLAGCVSTALAEIDPISHFLSRFMYRTLIVLYRLLHNRTAIVRIHGGVHCFLPLNRLVLLLLRESVHNRGTWLRRYIQQACVSILAWRSLFQRVRTVRGRLAIRRLLRVLTVGYSTGTS